MHCLSNRLAIYASDWSEDEVNFIQFIKFVLFLPEKVDFRVHRLHVWSYRPIKFEIRILCSLNIKCLREKVNRVPVPCREWLKWPKGGRSRSSLNTRLWHCHQVRTTLNLWRHIPKYGIGFAAGDPQKSRKNLMFFCVYQRQQRICSMYLGRKLTRNHFLIRIERIHGVWVTACEHMFVLFINHMSCFLDFDWS